MAASGCVISRFIIRVAQSQSDFRAVISRKSY